MKTRKRTNNVTAVTGRFLRSERGALIEKDHLLFFGDITKHKSFDEIQNFLRNEGCRFSFLKGYPLTDIGGLVLLEEKTK